MYEYRSIFLGTRIWKTVSIARDWLLNHLLGAFEVFDRRYANVTFDDLPTLPRYLVERQMQPRRSQLLQIYGSLLFWSHG